MGKLQGSSRYSKALKHVSHVQCSAAAGTRFLRHLSHRIIDTQNNEREIILNNHNVNPVIAQIIENDARKYQGDDVPYLNDEMGYSTANYAQQLVTNIWWKHEFKTDKAFKDEAVLSLMQAFMITEKLPMTIQIFHDCCTTASEYTVTSYEQLVDCMIENYREFEE